LETTTHEGGALRFILRTPEGFEPGAGLPLIVLMHGFGASMYDLADLAPILGADGYVYAFPNAPFTVEFGGGMTGFSWMTGRPGMQEPPPDAPSTESLLDGFIQEIKAETGAQDGRIILGGFSQGGGLTLSYGLPRPDVFAGLAVLSGFFRDEDSVKPRIPEKHDQPVFVAHGTRDQVVPIDRGRNTRTFLEGMGYDLTYREYEMAHEISSSTMRDLIAWLSKVMPPGPKP
jgi:phospholipase/carboxylesterase